MTIFPDLDITFQKNLNKSKQKYIPTGPVNYTDSKYVFLQDLNLKNYRKK